MNVIDIIVIIFLGMGFVEGYRKGLIFQVGAVVGVLIGIYGAVHFSDVTAYYLNKIMNLSETILEYTSLALTFALIYAAATKLSSYIDSSVDKAALGFVNNMVGALIGALKAFFIVSILVQGFNHFNDQFNLISKTSLSRSQSYERINEVVPTIFDNLDKWYDQYKDDVKEIYRKKEKY